MTLPAVGIHARPLQLELTKLPALPPVYEQSANAQQQLVLASER